MYSQNQNIENVIRSSLSTNQQGEQKIVQSALTDIEGAKQVARRLKETYDKSNTGYIDNMEVVSMIVDAYRSFNRVFNPSRQDIDSYFKVFDRDRDNKITLQDLEEVCIKYLCGNVTSNVNLASSGFGVKTSESQLRQSYGVQQQQNQNLQFTIGQQNFSNLMQQSQQQASSKYSSDDSDSDNQKKSKKK